MGNPSATRSVKNSSIPSEYSHFFDFWYSSFMSRSSVVFHSMIAWSSSLIDVNTCDGKRHKNMFNR